LDFHSDYFQLVALKRKTMNRYLYYI